MNAMTTTRKFLLFVLLATVALVGTAFLLAHTSGAFAGDHTLMLFDEDFSDSVVGWMIAIPIVLVAMVFTVIVLAVAGIVVVLAMAMVLMIALVVAVFGVLLGLIPIAAFLAVPAAIIWALIKVNRRNAAAQAAGA
ncbi:MAG: hypothetical protein ACK5D9_09380 [Burkholderiales bacterium]|jgi:hypothetical protein